MHMCILTYKSLATSNIIITRHCSSSSSEEEVDVKKKESEISLFQLMKRSMESVINVIFMPSWEESNRSDRHGQLASYDLCGLYFVWLFLFHSRIEKIHHAIAYELCWLIHQINEVRAWWRAFALTFVRVRSSYRVDYFIFHFRKTKIGSTLNTMCTISH